MKRKSISPKTRFEVFKRDGFKCQYCGRSAPDVVLVVDHIEPVANGGDNNIFNLVTSCVECNQGKGARELSDDSVVAKQRTQLELANERREQIKLMAEWRRELAKSSDIQVNEMEKLFYDLVGTKDRRFTDAFRNEVKTMIKKFGFGFVADCLVIAFETYGTEHEDRSERILHKWPGICWNKDAERKNPDLAELRHIANWFHKYRNDGTYRDRWFILQKLQDAYDEGWPIEKIWEAAKDCDTCYQLCNELGVYPY